ERARHFRMISDPVPGIVSVYADMSGRAAIWRRLASGELVREEERFQPWILLAHLEDPGLPHTELEGPGALRYLVRADDGRALASAVLERASRRLGRNVAS